MADREFVFQFRAGTSEEWAFKNRILIKDEIGLDTTKGNFKLGDGVTRWNDLDWFIKSDTLFIENEAGALAALLTHIQSPTPHPAYDDGPSFVLLYENAKV